MSNIRISDNAVAVDSQYFWQPMSTAPRGVKLQALNEGGVAVYATYNGTEPGWQGWHRCRANRPVLADRPKIIAIIYG